jgi:hypothetical protein
MRVNRIPSIPSRDFLLARRQYIFPLLKPYNILQKYENCCGINNWYYVILIMTWNQNCMKATDNVFTINSSIEQFLLLFTIFLFFFFCGRQQRYNKFASAKFGNVKVTGLASEPVWTQRLEEESFCLCQGSNLYRPIARSIVRHCTECVVLCEIYEVHLQDVS